LGGERRKVRYEMDITTRDNRYMYPQFARKDVLPCRFVTLDTTQLLISALNKEAPLKAVVF